MTTLAPYTTAARDVLDPAHLRAALRTTPADSTLAAAARCGLAVALALAVTALAGHRDLAGFAALAALVSLYGRWEPYRWRGTLLAVVGAWLVAVIVLSSAVAVLAAPAVVTVLLAAGVATATAVLCSVLRTGAPGATIAVFCVGAGLAGAPTGGDVGRRALAALVGAALAWLVCCAGWLLHPAGPARVAVRRTLRAVERADDSPAARAQAVGALRRAREVLGDDASHPRGRVATAPLVVELAPLAARLGVPDEQLPARRSLVADVRAGAQGLDVRGLLRILVAGVAAGGAAHGLGWSHSAWAVMGSTATLQGTSTGHAVVRGAQRAAGTAVGALVAWPLLAAHLDFWAVAALVVALQLVTETIVMRQYGLAMLTITPMALLMTSLGGPAGPTDLTLTRALDTVLGALVALVVLPHRARTRTD